MQNYEIHITVPVGLGETNIERFQEICRALGVKAIVIDAHPLTDVMTSFRMKSDDQNEVFREMTHQMLVLGGHGYLAIRTKVETDITHPAVLTPLPNQYFESHIQVRLNEQDLVNLKELQQGIDFHISTNALKPVEDGKHIRMVTLREYHTTPEKFTRRVEALRNVLKSEGFELAKEMEIEFALYDSNPHHDQPWLAKR